MLALLFLLVVVLGYYWYITIKKPATPPAIPNMSPPPLPEILNPQGDRLLKENPNYHLVFSPEFNQYLISVLGSPFEKYRQEAENELMNVLQIDTKTACQLKIVITTPFFANPDESGRFYKLSFCETASPSAISTPGASLFP